LDLFTKLNRNTVEELCKDKLDQVAAHVTGLLAKAGVTVDAVEVIGGGVRSPLVQSKLKSTLNKDLGFSLDSAHCISIGAALVGKSKHPEYGFQYTYDDPNASTHSATLDVKELEAAMQINKQLHEHDLLIEKTHAKKNEIETYIYGKRNQLDESSRKELVTSEEKLKILFILREAENWLTDLIEEDITFELLEAKMNEISNAVNTAGPRLHEQLVKEEEERRKAAAEAEEYLKTYKPEVRERDIPRTKAQTLEAAKKKKNQGNICFKDGDLENAISRYTQAIGLLEKLFDLSPDQKKEADEIKLPCYLNNAASYIKLQKYERARDNCTEALKMDPENVKALFRRGQTYYYLKQFEEAKKDLTAALKLEPNNAEVKKTLKTVSDLLAAQVEKEKNMYKKMFG